MHEDLIGPLLRRELGVEAAAIRPLIGGEVGRVFRVDASGASFVVKFVNASPEPPFAAERIDDRVYGSRWSNLVPAYDLLRANGVAVPVLQASGTLADAGLHYAVLDYLDGDPDDGSPAWAACVGAVLGRLHTITRAHHGWVGMDPADAVRWPSAFATSFRGWLARGEGHLAANLRAAVALRCEPLLEALSEPAQFVFSHTDGFQGVQKNAGGWTLLGVIDIEDHQFTDQRFVLAGFERVLPPVLWPTDRPGVLGRLRGAEADRPELRRVPSRCSRPTTCSSGPAVFRGRLSLLERAVHLLTRISA